MKQILIGTILLASASIGFADAKMVPGSECDAQNPADISKFYSTTDGKIINDDVGSFSSAKRVVCPMLNDIYGDTSLDGAKINVVHGAWGKPISCTVVVANPTENSINAVTLTSAGGAFGSVETLNFPRVGNGQKYNNYVAYCDLKHTDGVASVYYDE